MPHRTAFLPVSRLGRRVPCLVSQNTFSHHHPPPPLTPPLICRSEQNKKQKVGEGTSSSSSSSSAAAASSRSGEEGKAAEDAEEVEDEDDTVSLSDDDLVCDVSTKAGMEEWLSLFDADAIMLKPCAGTAILDLLRTRLPAVNGTFGQGTQSNRLLRFLVKAKALDQDFPTAASRVWTSAKKDQDNLGKVQAACVTFFGVTTNVKNFLKGFRADFLAEFERLGGDVGASKAGTQADTIALLGHLVCAPGAKMLWTEYNSAVDPANRLDEFNGPSSSKTATIQKLMSMATSMAADGLDRRLFTGDHCGTEGAEECLTLNPASAKFTDAAQFKQLVTMMSNKHDTLLANLDKSGKSYAVGTVERRMDCYENFICSTGGKKEITLFYCFILWEGQDVKHLSRVLPANAARGSADPRYETPVPGAALPVAVSSSSLVPAPPTLSAKERAAWNAATRQQALQTSGGRTTPNPELEAGRVLHQTAQTTHQIAQTTSLTVNTLLALLQSDAVSADLKEKAQKKLAEVTGL